MILTIPRRVEYLTGEAKIPENMPLFKFTPIKEGLTFYNNAGKLVAQLFKRDGAVTVTLGDGGSLLVKRDNGIRIEALKPVKEDEYEKIDEAKARSVDGEFVFFGNEKEAQYEIFHRLSGEIKPRSCVQVVAHPLTERVVNIKVNDSENLLLAVSLCMAVSML